MTDLQLSMVRWVQALCGGIGVILISLAFCALAGPAVGQEYYKAFQTFVATNSHAKNDWILAPHLVDTNNTALKTTNVLLSVSTARGSRASAVCGWG